MNQITTLQEAGQHLLAKGVVSDDMTVEGLQLLEVCGFSTSNAKARIDEQIRRHMLEKEVDFTISIVRDGRIKRNSYQFTFNAANHILLAAMTEQGKAARQEAIDMKTEQQGEVGLVELTQMFGSLIGAKNAEIEGAIQQVEEATRDLEARTRNAFQETQERLEHLEDSVAAANPLPEGYESIDSIRRSPKGTLSKPVATDLMINGSIPSRPHYHIYPGGRQDFTVYASAPARDLISTVIATADKVSPHFYQHCLVSGKFKIS